MLLSFFTVLFIYGYIITPALAVYSWIRWSRSQRRRSRRVRVSLSGLAVASVALVLGIACVALSSIRHGAFLYLAPHLRFAYGVGMALSAVSVAVTFAGAFQDNPLRLKALFVALGALDFWFLAGSGQ